MFDDLEAAARNRQRQAEGWVPGGHPINNYASYSSDAFEDMPVMSEVHMRALEEAYEERRRLERGD